jgi:hypothetical protein
MSDFKLDEELLPLQLRKTRLEAEGKRRIVWDDEGFIVEGQNVAEDIARQSDHYREEVEPRSFARASRRTP